MVDGSMTDISRNEGESLNEEQRLRLKLKRKAEERNKGSESSKTIESSEIMGMNKKEEKKREETKSRKVEHSSPSRAAVSTKSMNQDKPNDNGNGSGKSGGGSHSNNTKNSTTDNVKKGTSDSKITTETTRSDTKDVREPEKRRGRRRGRNRRRNRRRQEARQQAAMSQGNNMNASGRMMDNRSFYGHDYAMNGAQRHPGHGPGGGMHHHPPGRGMDGPRWERNGGPHFNQNDRGDPRGPHGHDGMGHMHGRNDHRHDDPHRRDWRNDDHRDPYNRGRHNRDFERRSPGRTEEEHQKRGGGSGTKLRSRDRDRDRNRDRDRDRDHRDRVRDHDRSRDRDRQREHDRSRERDRDRGGRGRSRSRSSTRSRSRSQSRSRSNDSSYDSTDEYSSSSSKSRSRSRSRSHTSQNDNDGSLGKNNQESSVGSRQKSKNENSGRKRTRSESPNSNRSRSGSRKKEHPNSSTNGRTENQQQTIKSESNDNSKRNEKGSGSENENKSKIVDICSNTRDSQPEGDKTCEGEGNKVIVRSISLDKEEGIDDEKGKMKDKNEDEKNSKKEDMTDIKMEDKKEDKKEDKEEDDTLTKDQRTVFVSQLVMRTEEKDIRRYFRRKCGCRVNDVILLRDKRTGRHKGCAYVELGKLEDVPRVLGTSGKTPDFQRFPILIKASEAEKNYSEKMNGSDGSGITNIPGSSATVPGLGSTLVRNLYSAGDKRIEAQKVYLGSIDRNVTQAQLYAIFSQFGQLEKVMLQVDTTTGLSKGFAFLSFKDAKVANLAIQVMSGQLLAGRSLRTGWANMNTTVPGLEEVTSSEFPENSVHLIQNVHMALTQLNGTGLVALPGLSLVPGMSGLTSGNADSVADVVQVTKPTESNSQISNVAEEAINAALGLQPNPTPVSSTSGNTLSTAISHDPKQVIGIESPTSSILVHHMFDKDEETEDNWEEDVNEDFRDECSKYGKLCFIRVMSEDVGGKIYATFETIEGAKKCAQSLAGRWFDKRQLKVEFISEESLPVGS